MYMHMCVYIHIYTYMYIHLCVISCVYIYISIYIYIHTYIHTNSAAAFQDALLDSSSSSLRVVESNFPKPQILVRTLAVSA